MNIVYSMGLVQYETAYRWGNTVNRKQAWKSFSELWLRKQQFEINLFDYILSSLFAFNQLFVYVFNYLFTFRQLFVYVFSCLFFSQLFVYFTKYKQTLAPPSGTKCKFEPLRLPLSQIFLHCVIQRIGRAPFGIA